MTFIPKPHEIYKHFKGNLYQIIAIAEHSETGEQLVVYQAMYGEFKIFARPLSMFISTVDKIKYPKAEQRFRFELQGPDSARQTESLSRNTGKTAENPISSSREMTPPPAVVQASGEELNLDPLVLEFLDADTYEQRLNILAGLHHRITNDMITTMAIVCDVEVPEGDVEERYEGFRNCLLTLDKYECTRLR